MKKLVLSLACVAALTAGCGGADNVGACNKFVQKVKCGSVDISAQVNCSAYSATTCDISAYFDCLSSKYVCVNGMYDSAKMATISECAAKAVCK